MSVRSGKQGQPAQVSKIGRKSTLDMLNELSDEELEEIAGGHHVTMTYLTKPPRINYNTATGMDLTGPGHKAY